MALSRPKYADLPDIDEDAPEIYETPELTDDASTIQTATQRTTSPAPSDELNTGRHDPDAGLDRHRLDRGEARRRFEQSRVDARDANFSDSLNGGRRSYIISTRRSRRRRDGGFQEGDESDSEDESLGRKLARLKREAEEVKSELQRREKEKEKGEGAKEEDDQGVEDGVEALSQMLNGLASTLRGAQRSNEAAGSKTLASELEKNSQSALREPAPPEPSSQPQPSTLTSLATISDRLTAVEGSLGLSTTTPTSSAPILPTLASLTSQITTLSTTLAPPATTAPTLNLETLSTRIQDLISQTDQLTLRRKAATQAATELRQARLKAATSPSAPTPHHSSYSTGGGSPYLHPQQRPLAASASITTNHNNHNNNDHNESTHLFEEETLSNLLAYDDQTSKINALYATIPRIQELSPLLPLVLERLRSLQAIHVGAAGVKGDLDAVERQQEEVGRSIEEWKGAVERVEEGLKEGEEIMRKNKEVVEGLVGALEGRLKVLEEGGRGD